MKAKALGLETEQSSDLKAYQKAQHKLSKRDFQIIAPEKLLKKLQESQLTFVGDFHSFDQSSRNVERILRALDKKSPKLAIGVEFVHAKDQNKLDAYIDGYLTELEFLDMINYQDSWRFPWQHYKKFFKLAKDKRLRVLALNSNGSLEQRDRFAGDIIVKYLKENQENNILVFFGELHILANKLPKKVKTRIPDIKMTIIHQNLDEVFWRILNDPKKANLTSSQSTLTMQDTKDLIVQFNEEEFSLQTSPPWTKYESIIYWYEHLVEDPDFEIHEYILESGLAFNSTVPDSFVYICEQLNEILNLKVTPEEIEDFNLYDYKKLELVEEKLSELPSIHKNFFNKLLTRGRSFKIPYKNVFYCPNYSVNRMTFLAGLHLQSILYKRSEQNFERLFELGQIERFSLFSKQMVMAYFSSKVLNPYRKCDHYEDLILKIQDFKTSSPNSIKGESDFLIVQRSKNILEYGALDFEEYISKLSDTIKQVDAVNLYFIAKICSYALGDLLYEHHYVKKSKTFSQIFKVLTSSSNGSPSNDIYKLYSLILPSEGPFGLKKRIF